MHFKAFSSRIEYRAFLAIALLSFVPISLLGYAAYEHAHQREHTEREFRLERELLQFETNFRNGLDQILRLAATDPSPESLRKLSLVSYHQHVALPSWTRQLDTKKPWLLERNEQLWLVPDPANSDLWLQIDQSYVEASLAKLAPDVRFCLSYSATRDPCSITQLQSEELALSRKFKPSARFNTNFKLSIHARTKHAGSVRSGMNLLTTLLLACILGVSAATLSMRRILAPIAELRRGTEALRKQNYDTQLTITSADEFQTLGEAFNNMTAALRRSITFNRTLGEIDRLILSTNNLEHVIQAILKAAKHNASADLSGEAWILTFGHEMIPAERLYGLNQQEKLTWSDTLEWVDEMPLIPTPADVEPHCVERISGLPIAQTYPVLLDEHMVAVVLLGANRNPDVTTQPSNTDQRPHPTQDAHLGELADRLSVAMTNIDRTHTLYKQANQDALTGLVNRQAFERELRNTCNDCELNDTFGALLFIDLDRFKQVNDTEGHKAGDRLLVVISRRLQQCMRTTDTIARLGGDEFAVILRDDHEELALTETCERIMNQLAKPMVVDRLEHSIHSSIGIASISATNSNADQILIQADLAMYHAKTKAGSKYAFYDPSLNSESEQRIDLESRLRQALTTEEIRLDFQPQLNLVTGEIQGMEGLLRWNCPVKGNIPPSLFIPIAEETGIILELEPIIFRHAAAMIERLNEQSKSHLRVAVNVSVRQIIQPGFARRVLDYLARMQINPAQLEVEVTESLFIQEVELVVQELTVLREAGIAIALDDFGTGYSSLNHVRTLPVDVIKIDRSFILELEESLEALELVESIIRIAKVLNKTVIAEGVETQAQLRLLRKAGCEIIQGYLLARPLPANDVMQVLDTHDATQWCGEPSSVTAASS